MMNPTLSSTSRKLCGKELGHVMLPPPRLDPDAMVGPCRGLL